MTVSELVSLPIDQQTALLNSAAKLKNQCNELCTCIKRQDRIPQLRERYVTITKQWNAVSPYLTKLESKRVARVNRQISYQQHEMQRMLQIRGQINENRLVHLAAELEVMANQLHNRIHRLDPHFRTRDFRVRCHECVDKFQENAKSFHYQATHIQDFGRLRNSCNDMIRSWNQLSVVVGSMPKNGISDTRFSPINQSRRETVGIVAEIAAYLTD